MRRSCFAADRTGHMILQTLYQNCVKQGVEFYNEFYVLDLLLNEGPDGVQHTAGVVAYELATGEIHFQAKSVVFATGGTGKVFKTTSNAHTLTGDGMGVAFRPGIPLEDMEFFQFHPTGLAGLGILLSEAARGEGGILRNSDGERFMERYAPTIKDLAPRDIVARSMANEVREGRGAGPNKDYVLLDLTHRARAHRRQAARHHRVRPHLPRCGALHRAVRSTRPRTTPWAGCRRTSRPRCCANNTEVVPGCMPPARSPACPSTAPTAWTNSLSTSTFGRRAGIAAADFAQKRPLGRPARAPGTAGRGHRRVHPWPPVRRARAPTCAASCRRPWTATSRCSARRPR